MNDVNAAMIFWVSFAIFDDMAKGSIWMFPKIVVSPNHPF